MAETVTSADGSTIAYEVQGSGPTLLVIGGAFSTRQSAAAVLPNLTPHFTVVAFDRRGRGDSTDASNPPPYEREREIEDVRVLLDAVGDDAFVYGHSSGAALAFEAAAAGASIARVAGYEAPYIAQSEPTEQVAAALAAGDRERATELFLVTTGNDPATMRDTPWWPGLVAVAHTLPYEFALVDAGVPVERFATIRIPSLVLDGGASPAWVAEAASALAASIPGATRHTLPGQTHGVSYEVLTPVLEEFFLG
ncbi:alpha/beta hydrolase [Diaminobutyricibacter tongyongensis]|uniref:Alpha/beta hydrolase n=1 Tax=Leifsonia tongyongensis TaxID=1268043 RepID=A0A6L9XVL0_9MICO|nr:alpha/beta hydrolase [Diaminobutyricibacter tongyongensis]NEN05471.1 alpha/beta hydrolase [Diaminobutyricibacter tongyongensis]